MRGMSVLKDKAEETKELAASVIKSDKLLTQLMSALEEGSRRERQQAARIVAQVARMDPAVLAPYANDLVDALDRPEA